MANPNIQSKAAGDSLWFHYDWQEVLGLAGDTSVAESHWNVDVGTMTIGSDGRPSTIVGTVTQCSVQAGNVGEIQVLNNSILAYPSGNKLVKHFAVTITDGNWEPMTPPVVTLPDGLPNVGALAAFVGATPGVSIWVDTTSSYPNGTMYYAVPESNPATPDGLTVVQGQLVKWIEVHAFNGTGSGVPLSRLLSTTSPLTIDGGASADLSANRTLAVKSVSNTTSGVVPPITGANTVAVSSDGATASWSTDPVVNTLTGTSALKAGPVGSPATLTANALAFASGNSTVTSTGSLELATSGQNLANLSVSDTENTGLLSFDANLPGVTITQDAAQFGSDMLLAAQSGTGGAGGNLYLSSGSWTGGSANTTSVILEVGGAPYFSINYDGTQIALDAHSCFLHDLRDPALPQDAATKHYVDSVAVGLQIKGAVAVVSTSNIASLSGLATTIDSVLVNTDGTRVLLTGQSTASQNGIYLVHSGAWTRSTDMAAASHASGSFAFVNGGTVYANSGWACSTLGPNDVVGTNSLVFTEFSAAGQVLGGAGLVKTGNTLDVVAGDTTLVVSSDSMRVGVISNANIASGVSWSKLTGFPTLATTAPLTGGGDLSANRTLAISAATTSAAGSMSPTQVTELNALLGATLLTDVDESATLPNSTQLSIQDGDPNSALVIDHQGSGSWTINAPFGTTSTTYMRGNAVSVSGTTNKLAKFTSSSGIGNSSITDDGSNVTIAENTTCSQNLTVTKDLVLGYQTIDRTSTSESIQDSSAANGGMIHVAASDYGSSNIAYNPHFSSSANAHRIFKDAGGFSLTGPSSSQSLAFYTAIHGVAVPSDGSVRNILGKLTLGWLGNGHITNGAAQEYLFALGLLADGTANTFFISTLGSVLNGGQAAPLITLSNSSNSFTFTIRANAAANDDVTKFCYWLQFEWSKS